MSSSKWEIVNGVKYKREIEESDTIYTYQTEKDVKKTTQNEIYFSTYIVTKDDDGNLSFKRRRIN